MLFKMENTETNFISKTKKNRQLRKKQESESDESYDETMLDAVNDAKHFQNLRKRPRGVDATEPSLSREDGKTEDIEVNVLNIKSGGLINMSALKRKREPSGNDGDAINASNIGTQFSAETNKRDEDDDMMKYIEKELEKRRKTEMDDKKNASAEVTYYTPAEAALKSVPDHLRGSGGPGPSSRNITSNQMLSGIPEVDLGIEVKIKNIEMTEEAKLKLYWERKNKKEGPSEFVPNNVTVNFVQHNRFNIEDVDVSINEEKAKLLSKKRRKHGTKTKEYIVEEKATDDYHYEKFKKQFRRY